MIILDFHIVTFLVAYLIVMLLTLIVQKRRGNRQGLGYLCVRNLYLLLLFKVTIFPIMLLHHQERAAFAGTKVTYTQLVPFHIFANMEYSKSWLLQTIGNLILLFPLPILLYLKPHKTYRLRFLLVSGILVSLGIEVVQLGIDLLTGYPSHVCDVDDLILNSIGVILATLLCKMLPARSESKMNREKMVSE